MAPLVQEWAESLLRLSIGAPSTWVGARFGIAARLRGAEARAPQAAAPRVQTTVESVYYRVVGSSSEALRDQMRTLGPRDRFGRWAASTRWDLSWTYPYVKRDTECRSGPVRVDLAVTFTYPRWDAPPDAPPDVMAGWERYLSALMVHENGHRDIAVEAAHDVARAIETVPASASCPEFERAADATAHGVVERYRGLQVAYDDATGHGTTQGAFFR